MTPEAGQIQPADQTGCRILVCDDLEQDVQYWTGLLESFGYTQVTAVRDAGQVVPVVMSGGFDLVLLNPEMAGADGITLIHDLRKRFSAMVLPILAVAGAHPGQARNAALSAGASDYLNKPVDPAEMALRVRNLLTIRTTFAAQQVINTKLESDIRARTAKLDTLIENGLLMSATRDIDKLFHHALFEGKRLLHCDAATLFLLTKRNTLQFAMRTLDDALPAVEIPLHDPHTGKLNDNYMSVYAAVHRKSVRVDDVYQEQRFDVTGTKAFDLQTHYRTVSVLAVPMASRAGQVLGVLQFINCLDPVTGGVVPFGADLIALVEALAAQAAVAFENLQLVEERKAFMESLIHTIATAIDAKSPYTGRHSERVPELALMLAKAASDCDTGSLAAFRFHTDDEWHEFRVGAWLHDCGKITTPEYVIDKATKLETLYNRIHEIRMRFEVLLRDADIERLQGLQTANAEEAAILNARFEAQRAQLVADFAFVAACNRGTESMEDADIERLLRIAGTTWLRHFDDRLGISHEEAHRRAPVAQTALPRREKLLDDSTHHIIPRSAADWPDPAFGFQVEVPEHLYNLGEVYNLSVRRGTLTAEERYKINEHMIHGIMMLERMPFPESLKRVPEYAGTHHETLQGTGYPRRIAAAGLSVPARIMAIADIFEALTATDRPYQEPRKFSQALNILHSLKVKGSIDADVFDLFLTSGVYLEYAHKYLQPQQMDAVRIEDYL
jgi:HD-GYP domain-containing protein (c-di-GMP phosphodiesterase class II)